MIVKGEYKMKQSKFQFLNPYLEEVSFKVNHDFISPKDQSEFEMQNNFDIQVKRSKTENRANVKLILKINSEDTKSPFELLVKVASDFNWEDLDEKTVEAMLRFNAPALLLGYMRPIVANITNSSPLTVYNLPFINFRD